VGPKFLRPELNGGAVLDNQRRKFLYREKIFCNGRRGISS